MRHVSAKDRRILAPAFHQFAIAVALAGLSALGLGMAKQHKAAHGRTVAFPN
jgi:hypothetical protein